VQIADENYHKLKSELPMNEMMAEVLDTTCRELIIR
jgi:hypothetical protein